MRKKEAREMREKRGGWGTLDMGTWIFRLCGLGTENKIYMLGFFYIKKLFYVVQKLGREIMYFRVTLKAKIQH